MTEKEIVTSRQEITPSTGTGCENL